MCNRCKAKGGRSALCTGRLACGICPTTSPDSSPIDPPRPAQLPRPALGRTHQPTVRTPPKPNAVRQGSLPGKAGPLAETKPKTPTSRPNTPIVPGSISIGSTSRPGTTSGEAVKNSPPGNKRTPRTSSETAGGKLNNDAASEKKGAPDSDTPKPITRSSSGCTVRSAMSHKSFMSKHREGELCREEAERARERATMESSTPYIKREWSKSMLEFYADYKKLEPEVAKARRAYYAYQKACISFNQMSAEQHDHAAELASKWEQAAYRAACARAEFQEKYPDAYHHPNDPGHVIAIQGHMDGKANANKRVEKHRAAEKIRSPPKYAPPPNFKRRSTRSLCSTAGIGDILDNGDE